MLRVLTLASLFPNAVQPTLGGFVARQTQGLAARDDVSLEVVAPVGQPVWPLSRHPHYARLRALPQQETFAGMVVHRPRFRVWPAIGTHRAATDLARALIPMLRALHRTTRFDVIDAEYFWPDGPAAVSIGKALGIPVSIKARGSDVHFWGSRRGTGEQVIAAGRAAAGLLAVSERLRQDMIGLGIPGEAIRVHRTGIDLDLFRPVDRTSAKAALGIEGPLLASAGGLIERKGQHLAIEALTRLPGATLMLVGDGPERGRLVKLARRLGVESRVLMPGSLPHAQLPGLLGAADVVVQPSAAEGLANVWVEAMACGTPVVTCDVGGAREAVDAGAGRIVGRDAGSIAAAIKDLLSDPPTQEEVRRAASKFSWERNTAELFDHLSALAGGPAISPN